MAAIKDVAKLAGMSVAVVSKYLKNPESVRIDSKDRIETAIKQLNYIPSPIARSLRTKRTGMISVVVPDITNPFFAELFESIRQECMAQSMLAILQTAEEQSEMTQTIQSIESRQVDGVILCFLDRDEFQNQLKARLPDIPVTVMSWHSIESAAGNIILDVAIGIREATLHVIRRGCNKIAYIGGPCSSIISQEKFKGFLSAAEKEKIQIDERIVKHGKTTMRYGHEVMREIYDEQPEVQAVICENDALAIGCITYCLHHNIRIPDQMLITGFDDIPIAAMFEPPITTVRLPIEAMGRCAVKMLQERLAGTNRETAVVFDTNLIIRKTTDRG
ncbi:MAG: LacI family DNA-binding transcriptional regulator [Saccharofermentanales bacterium]